MRGDRQGERVPLVNPAGDLISNLRKIAGDCDWQRNIAPLFCAGDLQ